ncbi:MAG: glutamate synthase [Clostridia bacterium]|nr:glutamate synthase [Clostridia bacterium]
MRFDAGKTDFFTLNRLIRECPDRDIVIDNCIGHRFIGAGMKDKHYIINGIPGNAMASYMDGATIEVHGNGQDAIGDTMNDGEIVIHGSAGDALGYAMRGGKIYVKGNTGYRAGIHMKAYGAKFPTLVIGGCAGSFLGEYQAGGLIIVLGIGAGDQPIVGNFCGTGMHGGRIYLRTSELPPQLPVQVSAHEATPEDLAEIAPDVRRFCECFGCDYEAVMAAKFTVLTPNTASPYKQMYTHN